MPDLNPPSTTPLTVASKAALPTPRLAAQTHSDQTFRLPSTTLFLGLMPVFSGLARRADLSAVLSNEASEKVDSSGQARTAHVHTYIVYSGRGIQSKTNVSLFDDDPLWNEGELSTLIKRQFGPTGLKHLLGVMIAAEEQSISPLAQPGTFVFDASRHLDILGYSRSNRVNGKGYHTAKHLKEAREIVMLLCSLTIVQETRLGTHRGTTIKVRIMQDEASAESWEETIADGDRLKERIITNEKIYLRFNPHLFNAAAEGTSRMQYLYTLQLKKLSRENARSQGLTLTLGVHLPIKFRLNEGQPLTLSARSFLRMAGIAEDDYTRYEHLERLENTLRHMVEQGYIASFETQRYRYTTRDIPPQPSLSVVSASEAATLTGTPDASSSSARLPSVSRVPRAHLELKANGDTLPPEPLEEMWTVEPPAFLRDLLKTAQQGALTVQRDLRTLAENSAPQMTRSNFIQALLPGVDASGRPPSAAELLKLLRVKMCLQQVELARLLNVTQAAVSMAEAGKRPRMAQRLLDLTRRLLPAESAR